MSNEKFSFKKSILSFLKQGFGLRPTDTTTRFRFIRYAALGGILLSGIILRNRCKF